VNESSRWHLEKTISISHIITTIGIIAAALSAYYSLGNRVTVIEERILSLLENQSRIDNAQDASLSQFREQMRDSTVEINSKLDLVIQELLSND
jgi:hypothetical protein